MRFRSLLRYLAALAATLSLALPARSVVPEKDLLSTLHNLHQELQSSYASALESDSLLVNNRERREQFSQVLKSADEVTIMLYTQRQEFAFDMAFALEEVSRVTGDFQEQLLLSGQYRTAARSGLRRYELLNQTLLEMYLPEPVDSLAVSDSLMKYPLPLEEEDPEKAALLDSCLRYSRALTDLYGASVAIALQDSIRCAEAEARLKQAYEYAQANYAETQKSRYIGGNVNIVQILSGWDNFVRYVKGELRLRYDLEAAREDLEKSETMPRTWNGIYVLTYAALALVMLLLSFLVAELIALIVLRWVKSERVHKFRSILTSILAILFFVFGMLFIKSDRANPYWQMAYQLLTQYAWLTLAIFISLLIRIRADQARASVRIYIPTLLLAFVCILMRAIFLPVGAVPLFLPPTLLVFLVWQSIANVRRRTQVSRADLRYMWASVGVMALAGVLSLSGYSMIGVLALTFWTFLLALLHTITTLYYLIKRYYEDKVKVRKARYHTENPNLPLEDKDAFIEVTWFYDLLRKVVIPLTIIASFPLSILLTSRAYQLSLTGADLLRQPLINEKYGFLNLSNILLVIALFFVFRYLIYLFKALFRVFKLRTLVDRRGESAVPLKESDVNLSLVHSLITLLGWALYVTIAFAILHIPTKAITTITAGLAAGIGFALKDLINNFFYGIQLMAGRIRVGDKISCDGVRGIVKRVSYQTTQVEDEDGSLIAFTNTELFSKKFRNLNSGRNYEFIKMPVGVRYGTDIELARKVILEALQPLMTKDKAGRDIVDPSFPVDVRFDSYGDSSVNLVVALYTTVETHYTFPARAKEAIYNAFAANDIEIPFPQRDVYIKTVPKD